MNSLMKTKTSTINKYMETVQSNVYEMIYISKEFEVNTGNSFLQNKMILFLKQNPACMLSYSKYHESMFQMTKVDLISYQPGKIIS